MNSKSIRVTTISACAAIVMAVSGPVASADQKEHRAAIHPSQEGPVGTSADAEDTTVQPGPPAEPEEKDLIEVTDPGAPTGEEELPSKYQPAPGGEHCQPGGVYRPTSKGGKFHKGVGATNANHNATKHTAKSRFESEVTGKVGVSVSAGLKVKVSTLIAEVEKEFSVNLSAELTAKLGNVITVNTPPKKTTHAKYGVYRLQHKGKSYSYYSNCSTTPKKTITSYTPYRVGWYIWES
ncbi:hypothetical protein [Streptomyces aureoverticillatus]|uniref:hypothetical protein n=1 Tax=Streptomyces aureoverticillatus TaxID=66871 RepID=UPI0013D8E6EC|nr:hypothetical protein [Streptomyces aureoverticillatus]QIB44919.1 hypothetical protein G3H79_19435 [Streptomyces aureoverticillatus]